MKYIALGLFALLACGCKSDTHMDDRPLGSATSASADSDAGSRIASDVRRAIADDMALSHDGRNVSVLADGGRVTLRGTVSTSEEKQRIEELARRCAGVTSVTNELRIRT